MCFRLPFDCKKEDNRFKTKQILANTGMETVYLYYLRYLLLANRYKTIRVKHNLY